MRRFLATLVLAVLAARGAAAQQPDPLTTRLKRYTETPIATFQGSECVSIQAPKSIVWRLLVGPETVSTWLLAGVPGVEPRRASYGKGPTATKGDVLSIAATTADGPRRIDLTVIALQPGELLALLVKSDDAALLDAKVERLTLAFFVDGRADGTTDLTWASHYDADSPFSALLSPTYMRGRHARKLAALNLFKAIAETAASLPYPPLHDVPTSPQPTAAPRRKK
ncbi:MAG TPA: SRPBCC family protein [Thermoanaerobaculia bacterium]|nr:SRPBCC family protein [Thermoanaerobaculia bacterium]